MLVDDTAVTLCSWSVAPGSTCGVGTLLQVCPFQCSISDRGVMPLLMVWATPTAHTSVAPSATTSVRVLRVAGLGLAIRVHAVPFQWATRLDTGRLVAL